MKIIAHKTDFYTNNQFFKEIINEKYIDGISINVLFNIENKILVYNFSTSKAYDVQQFQKTPINQLTSQVMLTLEQALNLCRYL